MKTRLYEASLISRGNSAKKPEIENHSLIIKQDGSLQVIHTHERTGDHTYDFVERNLKRIRG